MIKTTKAFLGDDFLLETDSAINLYEQHAAKMPIIDFHNHLSPSRYRAEPKVQEPHGNMAGG